jgi:hypothetical protein
MEPPNTTWRAQVDAERAQVLKNVPRDCEVLTISISNFSDRWRLTSTLRICQGITSITFSVSCVVPHAATATLSSWHGELPAQLPLKSWMQHTIATDNDNPHHSGPGVAGKSKTVHVCGLDGRTVCWHAQAK